MKTLIELYDERPIENVLGSEVFRPERTVFLCPAEVAQDKRLQKKLRDYFVHRGLNTEVEFRQSSPFSSEKLLRQLRSVTESCGECVIDITGGTDAALFACGQFCAETDIPAFTYSRRRGCFYSIHRAEFADRLPCTVQHKVEDCFMMAGGAMRPGRVDNALLARYAGDFSPFFRFYLRHRSEWTQMIQYIQQSSRTEKGEPISLSVEAAYTVRAERGTRVNAPEGCLTELEAMGFLKDVYISREVVRYTFRDRQIRAWLRDIGSVLELYVYQTCLDTGLFNDVRTSAVVDWEGDLKQENVTNEIDVMGMRGILPVFISCKTCEVSTEALNELAILRDRFGGHGAKAAIVTSRYCRSITRRRASELGIDVIDLNDLKAERIAERIRELLERD